MPYIADLHIHSCFSRATSRTSRLPGLAAWAAIKGIQVLGTGDFTHPGWLEHLHDHLIPAEPGFFKLSTWDREEIAGIIPEGILADNLAIHDVRFVLSSEISSIYKKDGKVRKIHNILYAPDFEAVRRINGVLAGIGNIESDGRPILGLDARNLLEIVLDNSPDGFLVPAHIWTPWFSLFGSKSGFDTIEECFGDLSLEIFALETGLSSDPAMNRCISALDRYTLISNSDCHSPAKLGREANIFSTGFDFLSIKEALRSPVDQQGRQLFSATIEFYPEEGKYHCDGHRKCRTCMEPHETMKKNGLCPVCGRPVTVGVLHRVMDLADRKKPLYPENAPAVHSLIPLPELLGELLAVGPGSKKVMRTYGRLINQFSSEFNLLLHAPIADISDFGSPLLAEAIQRVRSGRVIRQPGYDGEFGVIRVFEEDELGRLAGQLNLFGETAVKRKQKRTPKHVFAVKKKKAAGKKKKTREPKLLNEEQQAAVTSRAKYIVVQAGPGTGKTHTLVARLLYQLERNPGPVTVITFTNKAADEVKKRLSTVAAARENVYVATLHGYCLRFLRLQNPALGVAGPEMRNLLLRRLFPDFGAAELSDLTRKIENCDSGDQRVRNYLNVLGDRHLVDLDAIIPSCLALLKKSGSTASLAMRRKTGALYIDEFQDLNSAQYELVKTLAASSSVFAIGDPDQAIYGFRGADPGWFYRFIREMKPEVHHLKSNYRCDTTIIKAAAGVIAENTHAGPEAVPVSRRPGRIVLHESVDRFAEAGFIAGQIEELLGGTSHREIEKLTGDEDNSVSSRDMYSLQDIGVLYRTTRQAEVIADVLFKQGIPHQVVDLDPFYTRAPLKILYFWVLVAADLADLSHLLFLLGSEHGIGKATLAHVEQAAGECRGGTRALLSVLAGEQGRVAKAVTAFQALAGKMRREAAAHGVVAGLTPVLERYGMDRQQADMQRFFRLAGAVGSSLETFGSYLLQNSRSVVYDDQAEAVTLMTLHAAKGVEFPVVFLVGLEEGVLPMPKGAGDTEVGLDHIEEERRLFFVGLTRAQHRLYLSWSSRSHGGHGNRKPSRFIGEIPDRLISKMHTEKKKRSRRRQLLLFPAT